MAKLNLEDECVRVQAAIGRRIQELREEQDVTQEELAELSGIDYKRVQRIEAGAVNATLRTLVRIARALQAQLIDLID